MAEELAAQWPELEVDLISGPLQPSPARQGPSPRALGHGPPPNYKLTAAVDETIPATDITPAIPVRIYAPCDKGDDLPLIVFFHGGGYISGTDPPSLPGRPPG